MFFVVVLIIVFYFFFLVIGRSRLFTLFPYTTLFRSWQRYQISQRFQGAVRPMNAANPWSSCWKRDRKSTRLNSSHVASSYAVFCLKKKKKQIVYILLITK